MATQTTTIQVTTTNRDALLALGQIMQDRHPHVWSTPPSFSMIVGYALSLLAERDEQIATILPRTEES